jgi:predicted nucleic acid-binding Zn ribbon protein
MDALEKFLGGGAVASPPKPKSASVITDQLLDSLKKVESDKDPYALNKQSKAMGAYQFMPETVQMLHKQGIEFNPFNEKQAREAARTYLGQLVDRNNGDVDKALAQYGGFITKDPSGYVNKVKQGQAAAPTASTAPAAPAQTFADPLEAFLSGKPATAPAKPPVQTTAQPAQAVAQPAPAAADKAAPSRIANIAAQTFNKYQDVKKDFGERVVGAIDTAYGIVPAIYGAGVQALARTAQTPEQAEKTGQAAAASIDRPIGKALGITGSEAYQKPLGGITEPIAEQVNKMFNVLGMTPEQISEKTGIPAPDIRNMVVIGSTAVPKVTQQVTPVAVKAGTAVSQAAQDIKAKLPAYTIERQTPAPIAGGQSVGAAATSNTTMVQQALSVATPELQLALKDIPVNKINVPTFQRHIEADTLPIPVRLTEGQATGDVVKLSQEQNRRGRDSQLAERFNQQNKDLIDNVQEIRNQAAPDVYGTKTIENSQAIIDAYKQIDTDRATKISEAYKKLEDSNGGQFPVDGQAIAAKADALLAKKLKTEFLPSSIKNQLERFKKGEQMTFEQYEALRTNLAAEIRKAEKSADGNAKTALSLVRQAAEELPLQKGVAGNLKGLADNARSLAKERFDMIKKDPAYNAAVNDLVPADNFIQKFVINGVNKNVQTMVNNLGKDSLARQHMSAGTINWLADKAGIYGEQANFSQAGFNKGLKQLDAVKNTQEIFDPASATQLRTLGNVAGYTQFQPRGSFVNNSNTLVGSLAEKGKQAIAAGVEKGGNLLVPGLQLGTTVMEMRARRAAEAETRKALQLGAGIKQSGKNQINDLNK